MGRYVIGVTGASGSLLALRLMKELLERGHELYVTLTRAGMIVVKQEIGLDLLNLGEEEKAKALLEHLGSNGMLRCFDDSNIAAPIASGSFRVDAMIVLPCSMGTAHGISAGASGNLLERAADVTIKEQRKLILVPRESPLSVIHLKNLLELARCGVLILPPMPAFYAGPQTTGEMVDLFIGRLLDHLGIDNALTYVYEGI